MARPLRALLIALIVLAAGVVAWWSTGSAPPRAPRAAAGGELTASIRSEPRSYTRLVDPSAAADIVDLLTQDRLVRLNRATGELEARLAERWAVEDDGRRIVLRLREGVAFSDGAPFSSADVAFTFRALYDPAVNSPLAPTLRVEGQPIDVATPDPSTVVLTLAAPFAPIVSLLDAIPILPRHRLEEALEAGRLREAWAAGTPVEEVAGLGPFVLAGHATGERLVFTRNPHYWTRDEHGTRLPYLDRLTIRVVTDQNTEMLRLQAGEIDFLANGGVRAEDYAEFARLAAQGRLRLTDVGLARDPDFLWFNLTPGRQDAARPWLARTELRQALAHAADRAALANTVYLGAAEPIHGPVLPDDEAWYADEGVRYEHDPAKARELLKAIGLEDRRGDGLVRDEAGRPARFSILTQRGHVRERAATVLQEQFRQAGLTVDVVALDPGGIVQRWSQGDYDAIYFGVQASSTDPALSLEFWLSSGAFHFWHPRQASPATEWERRIDELMLRQVRTLDAAERRRLYLEVQRIFGEHVPSLYFVAPRVVVATSPRVANARPVVYAPQILWDAASLAVARPGGTD